MNDSELSLYNRYTALTSEQRRNAETSARINIAGAKQLPPQPKFKDFEDRQFVKFPPVFIKVFYVLVFVLMYAAFLPSSMRIHETALRLLAPTLGDGTASQYIAALCIVLLAEICQIVFSLGVLVVDSMAEKLLFGVGASIGTLIAIVGNGATWNPEGLTGFGYFFSLLETFMPPIITIISAWLIKSQVIHATSSRHHANEKWIKATENWESKRETIETEWQNRYETAHQSPDWMKAYAISLWDQLKFANRNKRNLIAETTPEVMKELIRRELQVDEQAWWNIEDVKRQPAAAARQLSEVSDAKSFTGQCPKCGKDFAHATEIGLKRAMSAHSKAHKNKEE